MSSASCKDICSCTCLLDSKLKCRAVTGKTFFSFSSQAKCCSTAVCVIGFFGVNLYLHLFKLKSSKLYCAGRPNMLPDRSLCHRLLLRKFVLAHVGFFWEHLHLHLSIRLKSWSLEFARDDVLLYRSLCHRLLRSRRPSLLMTTYSFAQFLINLSIRCYLVSWAWSPS